MKRSPGSIQHNQDSLLSLRRCAEAIQSGEPREDSIDALTEALYHDAERANWRSSDETDWLLPSAREAAETLYNRLCHLVHRTNDDETLQERVVSLAESFSEAILFSPEMVARLYAPDAPQGDPMISYGVDRHCRFIRRAVSQVIRRYGGSIRHLSTDATALQDDLYSCALEEIVKALSDSVARVWRMDSSEVLRFPPSRRRGWKQSFIIRVAMDPPATRLATLRSDGLLGVWDIEEATLIRAWTMPNSRADDDRASWHEPYFSRDGQRIAWQSAPNRIAVVSIEEENSGVEVFCDEEREAFLNRFGQPHISKRIVSAPSRFTLANRWDTELELERYRNSIYHWTCDASGTVLATASEIERGMPQWMRDIGFQNAVYYILKRRLVDLVRKQTLRDSSEQEDSARTSSDAGGLNVQIPIDSMSGADMVAIASNEGDDWRSQHDMERILAVLKEITITYKNRAIPCDVLAGLKAEGKTNTEIGEALGVPRGSVDYLWNQCREQIHLIFGDELV